MTDWRALCAELLDEVTARPLISDRELLARARAALAQARVIRRDRDEAGPYVVVEPQGEGPTDKEIMELMPAEMHDDLAAAARAMAEQARTDSTTAKGFLRIILNRHAVDMARAVLARYGRPTPPPADKVPVPTNEDQAAMMTLLGEGWLREHAPHRLRQPASLPSAAGDVGELVEWLRVRATWCAAGSAQVSAGTHWAKPMLRAADLLSRLALQPVPVAERLPGPEDCDAEGRCWLLTVEEDYPQWRLHSIQGAQPGGAMIWVPVDSSPGVMVDCFYTSHWLPAHALPVPASEVQP